MTTLREFYDILSRHDYFFAMSDDSAVWRRGQAERDRIERISGESPAHRELWLAWADAKNRGTPLPPRPSEDPSPT
jgi:hypothetical protein